MEGVAFTISNKFVFFILLIGKLVQLSQNNRSANLHLIPLHGEHMNGSRGSPDFPNAFQYASKMY
jgi:hypothetical protein